MLQIDGSQRQSNIHWDLYNLRELDLQSYYVDMSIDRIQEHFHK